jgi:hypothetical protein
VCSVQHVIWEGKEVIRVDNHISTVCIDRLGDAWIENISPCLAYLYIDNPVILAIEIKGRIVERLHFASNRFSIHGREFTSCALRNPSKSRPSIAADK